MFAAVGGSKGARKRQQIETWFETVSSQNRARLKAGQLKGTKLVFWELHVKQYAPCLRKWECFDLLLDFPYLEHFVISPISIRYSNRRYGWMITIFSRLFEI